MTAPCHDGLLAAFLGFVFVPLTATARTGSELVAWRAMTGLGASGVVPPAPPLRRMPGRARARGGTVLPCGAALWRVYPAAFRPEGERGGEGPNIPCRASLDSLRY